MAEKSTLNTEKKVSNKNFEDQLKSSKLDEDDEFNISKFKQSQTSLKLK